jgi:pyruvate kinase
VQIGHRILINDGLVELVVIGVDEKKVTTRVIHGGPISSKKGMNFPDSELTIPAITDKDKIDVKFAVEQQLDYIAASFVRRKSDIVDLRDLLHEAGGDEINVIAKLEKPQAIDNLDEILEVSDGVMVARGDLGVELPPEAVPIIQKKILARASRWGRFAITATQMLESMTTNSRPTRAEASDVANAIFDGSDAVMLSAETASGKYPVEAVQMMARIVFAPRPTGSMCTTNGSASRSARCRSWTNSPTRWRARRTTPRNSSTPSTSSSSRRPASPRG